MTHAFTLILMHIMLDINSTYLARRSSSDALQYNVTDAISHVCATYNVTLLEYADIDIEKRFYVL